MKSAYAATRSGNAHEFMKRIPTYLKYVLTGIGTKIHSTLFLAMCIELLRMPILLSYVLAFTYAVCFNFALNTRWVFLRKGTFLYYLSVVCSMLLINLFVFKILLAHAHYAYASVLVSILTYPIHFFLNQKYVFTEMKSRK